MADIGPGQWPSSPSFEAVNFRVNTPVLASETTAGKIRRVAQGHSYYSFEVKYPNLTDRQLGQVLGFMSTALGQMYSFEVVLPELSYSKAPNSTVANSTAQVSATISSGQRYALLKNCGANVTILAAGDFIRFNNHSKVYMVTQDCASNGAGVANLQFSGACVSSVPVDTKIWANGVPFTCILSDPQQSFDVTYGGIGRISLPMREIW